MTRIVTWWLLFPFCLILIVLASTGAGCGSSTPSAKQSLEDQVVRSDASSKIVVPAGEPIVLGVSEALTGSEAPAGIEDRDAVVTSVVRWKAKNGKQIKGHEIEVRAEDDGCTEEPDHRAGGAEAAAGARTRGRAWPRLQRRREGRDPPVRAGRHRHHLGLCDGVRSHHDSAGRRFLLSHLLSE